MSKTTRVSSPMEDSLRVKVKESQSLARLNRGGSVIGYSDGDDVLDNLCEPSYPNSISWEGWPDGHRQAGVAGRKLKEPESDFGSFCCDDDGTYSTVTRRPGKKEKKY